MLTTYATLWLILAAILQPSAAETQPAKDVQKPRLAVLDFIVEGKVEQTGSSVVAGRVRKELHESDQYDLMDRDMMKQRMMEKDFTATDECDQTKCLVKAGKSLEVQKIVGGKLASFGDSWTVEMRLIDVNTGREERHYFETCKGQIECVLDLAGTGARALMGAKAEIQPATSERTEAFFPMTTEQAKAVQESAARKHGLKLIQTLDLSRSVKLELVLIPAGEFMMGSNDGGDDEKPVHRVTISKCFYMGKYEVTQAQWQAVMGNNPSKYKSNGNLPVEQVTWDDCQEFCKKLSSNSQMTLRLPTEAEWEYACRAGTTTQFYYGNQESEYYRYGNYCDKSNTRGYPYQDNEHDDRYDNTAPVGSYLPNAWGLYDMHGNVCEWCQDWFSSYSSKSQVDPTGAPRGSHRVLHSGSWLDFLSNCRTARRYRDTPDSRNDYYGLRVVGAAGSTAGSR